jgi:penicillin amidase
MTRDTNLLVRSLGQGRPIADVCAPAGISREQFDALWRDECRKRLSPLEGEASISGLRGGARIVRDGRGVPHVLADNDADLFTAFGYAVAQDRLFQLDYLRRKATGTLAAILGPEALESDTLYRTLDLAGIARSEAAALPEEAAALTAAYCRGVNAWREHVAGNLPIEFALLNYEPTPFTVADLLAIVGEFRWYLTGRFPVIAIPELVKRAVGDGPLYRDFITGEADDESILQPGEYAAGPRWPGDRGSTAGGEAGGSNNWAIHGSRTATGKPLLASDPHIPYHAVSIWHEVHLCGGSFNVAGVALAGMPAVMIGRNERVAWSITNNICSQRDLYQEKTDAAYPGCFLYDGQWERAAERQEVISVRRGDGVEGVAVTARSSRNGPIVDNLLPPEARHTGPVSLRWLGAEPCGWMPALIAMNRAGNCEAFREAARPWSVPTFNLVFADTAGNIGFQTVGRIPLRKHAERGYRPGWDSEHQWQGFIPFDSLPHLANPARGFVATANNRLAPDDFPFPLSGCWATGYRHRRLRERLQGKAKWDREDCRRLQLDTFSGRAAVCVPALVALLKGDADFQVRRSAALLADWDFRVGVDSVPATLFNVFFQQWCRTVAAERLPPDQVVFVAANAGGIATRLLHADPDGWFHRTPRDKAVRTAFAAALNVLTARLGPNPKSWAWGNLHRLEQKHFLSGRGDLGSLLDLGGTPAAGDSVTVCAGTLNAGYQSYLGAGYRMVVDLSDPQSGLCSVEVAGASGQPGAAHYADQLEPWNAGTLVELSLHGEPRGPVWDLAPDVEGA